MVWHQFCTVQFLSHQFAWKVHLVQFGAWGPRASVQFSSGSVQSIEPQIVCEEQRNSSRPPPAEIPVRRPGVFAWMEGWCALLAVLACLSGMWCGVSLTQIQFKIEQKFVQFHFACLIGSTDSTFSSVRARWPRASVQFIQFSSRTLPALRTTDRVKSNPLSFVR